MDEVLDGVRPMDMALGEVEVLEEANAMPF